MNRGLKSSTAAFLALLAVAGFGASVSQAAAASLNAASYPAALSGAQVGSTQWVYGGGVRTITCISASLTGTITGSADPVTLTPSFTSCHALPNTLPVTVTMNGCDYSYTANTTGSTLTTDLLCPSGHDVEFHLYENATKHAENVTLCAYTVKEQKALPAGTYDNRAGGTVRLTVNASPITTVTKGSKILCGAAAGSTVAMTLAGVHDLTGKTEPGGAADALEIK